MKVAETAAGMVVLWEFYSVGASADATADAKVVMMADEWAEL